MNKVEYTATELNRLISYLHGLVDKNSEEYKIFDDYIQLQKKRFIEEYADENRPFLSVIMRTQGKRPDMLTEALLCLCGQSDADFELLITGHNLDKDGYASVQSIINEQPDWFRAKIRYIDVRGGSRATPLNRGFEEAKGKYVSIFDDDDLVFDNWVSEFRKASENNEGKILHTYSLLQDWEVVGKKYNNTPISMSSPDKSLCEDYYLIKQLLINICPTLALAYPTYPFKRLGIHFDESLNTTEDWDFLMRTAFVTGIANNPVATSIYRKWQNAENSQTQHSQDEWDKNYFNILKRFKSIPILFDKDSIEKTIDASLRSGRHENSLSARLFFDDNSGFNASRVLKPVQDFDEKWQHIFDFSNVGKISKIRIDPFDDGRFALFDIQIKVAYEDGSWDSFGYKQIKTNGYKRRKTIVFLKDDPQLIVNLGSSKKVKRVYYKAEIIRPLTDAMIDDVINKNRIIYRSVRKVYRIIRRIIKV